MPTLGTRGGGSVRGFGRFGGGKPSAPTINSVTRASDTSVTINYTLGSNNGAPITTIGFTSSPSIALTFTNTDLDGTITVTGSFAQGTEYTFTMTATNAVGTSDASSVSSSVIPNPIYSLSQTFNSSGTFTVPAGKNLLALAGTGAGGGGGTGIAKNSNARGGGGGGGGGQFIVGDISVTPGDTYTVTIGAGGNSGSAGGVTSFGNIVTANSGSLGSADGEAQQQGPGGNASFNLGTGVTQGGGGGGKSATYASGQNLAGPNSVGALNSSFAGVSNILYGGGGGAGGSPSVPSVGQQGPTNGGSPFGGDGGSGGAYSEYNSNSGNAANGKGGGGGGGGGKAGAGNCCPASGNNSGGTGGGGQILVYVK